jgi:IS1 family transposase
METLIKRLLVRGIGVRDAAAALCISAGKVLKTLRTGRYTLKPKQAHYDVLELDELWTYVGKKENKLWLIYAYHRKTGEIVAYAWGKRDLKTAAKLRKRLKQLGVSYDHIACDDWNSFLAAFKEDSLKVGKRHTVGVEGNNCRLRHRVRRFFRRSCCFSKNIFNHWKAFDMTAFYINYGYV